MPWYEVWYLWIGMIGSVGISIFTLPQLISIIKTKNTAFVSITMYAIYLIGCFCFLTGGILMTLMGNLPGGLPLVVAQSICGIISTTIFVWKLKNYFIAKRARISEFEYCKRFKQIPTDGGGK